ncbi:MAG: cupin domain-containing protein [Alphaproteobacteria bacterium]|nr:cupin domain-containing protein [Alphaproteobacteria bacterium]
MSAALKRDAPMASALGRDIRGLRRAKGMTLADLGTATNLSEGFLSQVERGGKQPSIGTLQHISEALGVAIGWFFEVTPAANPDEGRYIVRKESRRRLAHSLLGPTDYLGMTDVMLSPSLGGRLAMVQTTYDPGGHSGDNLVSHEGEEAGVVVAGVLEVQIDERKFLLREGDSFTFPSTLPHRYANAGNGPVTLVFAITPVVLHY